MWGSELGYLGTAKLMYRQAGISPFFHAIAPTLWRDCLWASVFQYLRHHSIVWAQRFDRPVRAGVEFTAVTAAGGVATALSSPLNYARNVVFKTPADRRAPNTWRCVYDLFREARGHPGAARFLAHQLNVGWGTARVAVGMAVSSKVYESTKAALAATPVLKHTGGLRRPAER